MVAKQTSNEQAKGNTGKKKKKPHKKAHSPLGDNGQCDSEIIYSTN